MKKRGFKRIAVFAGTAALAAGGVAGCGSDTASSSGATQGQQQGQPPQGGGPEAMAANLAKELGLSTEKVQAALAEVMPQGGPPAGGPGGTPPGQDGAAPSGSAAAGTNS